MKGQVHDIPAYNLCLLWQIYEESAKGTVSIVEKIEIVPLKHGHQIYNIYGSLNHTRKVHLQ